MRLDRATFSSPQRFKQPTFQYVGHRDFILLYPYVFTWEQGNVAKRIIIPAGYDTDKASVPRIFWSISPPDGEHEAAALIHDRLYEFKGKLPKGEYQVMVNGEWVDDPSPWTRKEADKLFRWMCILGGMSPARAQAQYLALRMWPPLWFKF